MPLVGEQILAVTGVLKAIEPGPLRVTKAQFREADKVPVTARKRMAEAIEAKSGKSKPLPSMDYDHLLEILPPPVTPARLQENLSSFPDQALANEYADALGRAWGYLQTQFPLRVREHLSGVENVTPPGSDVGRFRRVLAVVEDPMSVIDRIQSGELLAAEVETLKQTHPHLLELFRQLATEALIDEAAKRRKGGKDWQLPPRKDQMLRRLLEMPSGTIEQRSSSYAQQLYEEQRQQEEQQDQHKAPSGKPPETDAELTRTQRIDAK